MMVVIMTVMVVVNERLDFNVGRYIVQRGANLIFLVCWNPSIQCKCLVCDCDLGRCSIDFIFTREVLVDCE